MKPTSPWLDVHRPSGPQPHVPIIVAADETDPTSESTADSESRTNPWENVESATRPSQSSVDLPSPDQPADD
jgi:hypothetical protein